MKRCICFALAFVLIVSLCAVFPLHVNAQSLTSSPEFIEILKKNEGFSPMPYWDYAQYSIGYGTKCPDDMVDYYREHGITQEEATRMLMQELSVFESEVNWFAREYELTFSQHQFDALVSFTYNCGSSWVYETDGYFNRAVREGKGPSDFLYAMCLWSSAGGEYILIKRRMSEANMYINGVYESYSDSDDGTYPDTYKYVFLDGNGGTSRYTIHGYDANDPMGITTDFTYTPSGTDPVTGAFTYEFAGWFTERIGGTKIERLDGTLQDGTVLYAQWKDPAGETVSLPKGQLCAPQQVTVSESVRIRSGPGTFYPVLGQLQGGENITITQTFTQGSYVWGEFDRGWVRLDFTNYFDVVWPRDGVINGTGVNVRSGPGTNYPVQYQVNTGDAVTIHGREYGSGLYWGRLSDGNWVCLEYVTLEMPKPSPSTPSTPPGGGDSGDGGDNKQLFGDIDKDSALTKDDAIYLLRYVVFPDKYPIAADGDITKDGKVDKDDAIYLLRHVVFPDKYPLSSK